MNPWPFIDCWVSLSLFLPLLHLTWTMTPPCSTQCPWQTQSSSWHPPISMLPVLYVVTPFSKSQETLYCSSWVPLGLVDPTSLPCICISIIVGMGYLNDNVVTYTCPQCLVGSVLPDECPMQHMAALPICVFHLSNPI